MRISLLNRRKEYEVPKDAIAEPFLIDINSNYEQVENADYEQYMSENERNYTTYGQNSVSEEKESKFIHTDVTYGQDALQERFKYI